MTNQRLRAALAAMPLAALAPINALAGAATPPPTGVESAQLDQASNTSLVGEEMKHYYGLVEEVWKQAEAGVGEMRP